MVLFYFTNLVFLCVFSAMRPHGLRAGSSVRGIFQVRILEWVAISYSMGSSQPKDQTFISSVSYTGKQILYHWATWETLQTWGCQCNTKADEMSKILKCICWTHRFNSTVVATLKLEETIEFMFCLKSSSKWNILIAFPPFFSCVFHFYFYIVNVNFMHSKIHRSFLLSLLFCKI